MLTTRYSHNTKTKRVTCYNNQRLIGNIHRFISTSYQKRAIQLIIDEIHEDITRLYNEILPLETDIDIDMVCFIDDGNDLVCSS